MTNTSIETLSKAIAINFKIDSHTFDSHFGIDKWLIDDTQLMTELAVEHDIYPYFSAMRITQDITYWYAVGDIEVYIKDHESKLHAWRWCIGLALMNIK